MYPAQLCVAQATPEYAHQHIRLSVTRGGEVGGHWQRRPAPDVESVACHSFPHSLPGFPDVPSFCAVLPASDKIDHVSGLACVGTRDLVLGLVPCYRRLCADGSASGAPGLSARPYIVFRLVIL